MTTEVEWRRRWKPDFKATVWKKLTVGDNNYLVKTKFTENSYELLLTNYVRVWHETLDEDKIKKRNKKLNPSVEASVRTLLDHVRENVEEKKKGVEYEIQFKETANGQAVVLTVNATLAGLPLIWRFHATPADESLISEHLTLPLLSMVGELNRRQKELYTRLKAKDKEIDDYKTQGVRVTRKHLETAPFDETNFINTMDVSKGIEEQVKLKGTSAFEAEGQDLYRQIMMKDAWIHRGPAEVLEGESLMDEGSAAGPPDGAPGQSWENRLPPSVGQQGTSSPVKKSPMVSPTKSPGRASGAQSAETSPGKDTELLRRQALERRLQEEAERKGQKERKKKKVPTATLR